MHVGCSEDLSISAAGGLLSSRATSLDNLVAEADREQVQSAVSTYYTYTVPMLTSEYVFHQFLLKDFMEKH